MKFADVKVDDKLLVTYSYGFGGHNAYTKGTVTHVTKTRFTVSYADRKQVFTKDGNVYPSEQGYSRSYTSLGPLDDKALSLIRKHRLAVKARNLAHKLDEIFGNANYRERIVNAALNEMEMEENIALLEKVIERFSEYATKGE